MDKLTQDLIAAISDYQNGEYENAAYNIRENGGCAGRKSTENIKIEGKPDGSGIDIYIKEGTKDESVFIPACVTRGNLVDTVYNDFHVGKNADVKIIAGCGIHSEAHDDGDSTHNGVHRFFVGEGAHVIYEEKHIGTGEGGGGKHIDPVAHIELEPDSVLEMNTVQISGVDSTSKKTTGRLGDRARLVIRESIMTEWSQTAETEFEIDMDGEDCAVDLVSRSVAKDESYQNYHSVIRGNNRCTGHSECDAILVGHGKVNAAPELYAGHLDASLIHEAAIGKVAGEQILKLRTLGLNKEEAEETIINGFLKAEG